MISIHQAFGGTPVIFIRFNPDSYLMNGIKQLTSIVKRKNKNEEIIY